MADADTIDSTGTVSPGSPAVRGATADRSQSQPIDSNRLLGALGISGLNSTLAADRADVQSKEPGPPKLTPMPPPAPPTDPFQAFGQPAMWLAALGSLLTRQPLTAAIQSAGAVLKSTHDQDLAAAQQHFNEWKINSENAMKMAKYEQDAYKAAITKYGTDARAGEAQIRTVAAAFKNEALLKVYQTEGMTGVVRYLKKGSADTSLLSERALKLQDEMQTRLDKVQARQDFDAAHPELKGTPQLAEAHMAIDRGEIPAIDKPTQTPAQKAKAQQVSEEATGLVNQINRLETLIDKANKAGVQVTGGRGWIQRMYERGASVAGMDAGTAANQAESEIAGLRLNAMSFLRRARPNMYTEQQLEDLVRGMGFGETGEITKSGLEELRQIINDNAEITSGTSFTPQASPETATEAPPAPPLPKIDNTTKRVFDIITGGH